MTKKFWEEKGRTVTIKITQIRDATKQGNSVNYSHNCFEVNIKENKNTEFFTVEKESDLWKRLKNETLFSDTVKR